jgi:hypothetical protein
MLGRTKKYLLHPAGKSQAQLRLSFLALYDNLLALKVNLKGDVIKVGDSVLFEGEGIFISPVTIHP